MSHEDQMFHPQSSGQDWKYYNKSIRTDTTMYNTPVCRESFGSTIAVDLLDLLWNLQ